MWTQRPVSTLTPWTISLFRLTNQLVFNVHCLLFQDCEIKPCPTCSYPGLWVQPMLDLEGAKELQTYILKATPTTPTEPQKNWTFRKFVQKCHEMAQKWPQMTQSGPNVTQKGPKLPKNDPKWPKIAQKWPALFPQFVLNFFAFRMYARFNFQTNGSARWLLDRAILAACSMLAPCQSSS